MAVRIITGTISEATDPFDYMKDIQESCSLDRYYWTELGWVRKEARKLGLGTIRDGCFKIIQPTSVGKSVLAVTFLYYTHIFGRGNIAANIPTNWGKEITSLDQLTKLSNTHILLDDLKGTILNWKAKSADLVGEVANAGGKKNNQFDTTVQRTTFAPPDLRELCDMFIVPWLTKVDRTRESPRGGNKGVPVEIAPLAFTAGFEFLGFYNPRIDEAVENFTIRYDNETGAEILAGFDTLKIANQLQKKNDLVGR